MFASPHTKGPHHVRTIERAKSGTKLTARYRQTDPLLLFDFGMLQLFDFERFGSAQGWRRRQRTWNLSTRIMTNE
jgi:hypothetical protein